MSTKQATKRNATKRAAATTTKQASKANTAKRATTKAMSCAAVLRELNIHNAKNARQLLRNNNIARDDAAAVRAFFKARAKR